MSTEYRRGIPSVAHVEAATRLGLEWHAEGRTGNWRFHVVNGAVQLNLQRTPGRGPLTSTERNRNYHPIRTDGTPVDWEVLDAEVVRVAQPATVTPTASIVPTTQPQGFRADLWRRTCRHFISADEDRVSSRHLGDVETIERRGCLFRDDDGWQWLEDEGPTRTDILTRWAVYQELKPLYDLVDGAQGEVAMPRDVELEWCTGTPATEDWILKRGTELTIERPTVSWHPIWRVDEAPLGVPLRNFVAVLDAVAEQRVAARQGPGVQSVATTGTLEVRPAAMPEPRSFADVRPDRHGWRWWRTRSNDYLNNERFQAVDGRFSWFRTDGSTENNWISFATVWWHTLASVIPTDEQGNPVSWESIGQGQSMPTEEVRRIENAVAASVQEQMARPINWRAVSQAITQTVIGNEQRLAENPEIWREAQRQAASSPRTAEAIYQDLLRRAPPMNADAFRELQEFTSRAITQAVMGQPHIVMGQPGAIETHGGITYVNLKPTPLPRFTADELDDVDHSATTTQDSATLKRGKLPTVEAIGKYREVLAKRNGTVAEAVKASGIDCEVAQYVLERWASGLSDKESWRLLSTLYPGMYQISIPPNTLLRDAVDTLAWNALNRPTLDTSEPADTAAQRQRAEAAERKARMTALQAQLAKERAARVSEPEPELSRFALLEVDEAADPARSIEAWKAQRTRNIVRPAAVPAPQPAPAQRRKALEVVDAQAEGLSGTAALAVLLGRAMNGGC